MSDGDGLVEVQRAHWQWTYRAHPGMYGAGPSEAARYAAAVFAAAGAGEILELGCGHGRDALFFAGRGFRVSATDFSAEGLDQVNRSATTAGLAGRLRTEVHDARDPLPLEDASVDGVFAHMLLCMALSTKQIANAPVALRPGRRPAGWR
jgi:SAM-dependent methyltransferase